MEMPGLRFSRPRRSCLKKEGAANLSLRRLSQDAGLSRQAPYNHFADKEALLAELVREGFAVAGR